MQDIIILNLVRNNWELVSEALKKQFIENARKFLDAKSRPVKFPNPTLDVPGFPEPVEDMVMPEPEEDK